MTHLRRVCLNNPGSIWPSHTISNAVHAQSVVNKSSFANIERLITFREILIETLFFQVRLNEFSSRIMACSRSPIKCLCHLLFISFSLSLHITSRYRKLINRNKLENNQVRMEHACFDKITTANPITKHLLMRQLDRWSSHQLTIGLRLPLNKIHSLATQTELASPKPEHQWFPQTFPYYQRRKTLSATKHQLVLLVGIAPSIIHSMNYSQIGGCGRKKIFHFYSWLILSPIPQQSMASITKIHRRGNL